MNVLIKKIVDSKVLQNFLAHRSPRLLTKLLHQPPIQQGVVPVLCRNELVRLICSTHLASHFFEANHVIFRLTVYSRVKVIVVHLLVVTLHVDFIGLHLNFEALSAIGLN